MTDRDGTRVRAQCHDDFFWMMATVAAENKDGDAQTRMVTNDRMRDHWHKLLGKRPFLRWSSSQIIRCVHLNSRGVRAFPANLILLRAQLRHPVWRRWHAGRDSRTTPTIFPRDAARCRCGRRDGLAPAERGRRGRLARVADPETSGSDPLRRRWKSEGPTLLSDYYKTNQNLTQILTAVGQRRVRWRSTRANKTRNANLNVTHLGRNRTAIEAKISTQFHARRYNTNSLYDRSWLSICVSVLFNGLCGGGIQMLFR